MSLLLCNIFARGSRWMNRCVLKVQELNPKKDIRNQYIANASPFVMWWEHTQHATIAFYSAPAIVMLTICQKKINVGELKETI